MSCTEGVEAHLRHLTGGAMDTLIGHLLAPLAPMLFECGPIINVYCGEAGQSIGSKPMTLSSALSQSCPSQRGGIWIMPVSARLGAF